MKVAKLSTSGLKSHCSQTMNWGFYHLKLDWGFLYGLLHMTAGSRPPLLTEQVSQGCWHDLMTWHPAYSRGSDLREGKGETMMPFCPNLRGHALSLLNVLFARSHSLSTAHTSGKDNGMPPCEGVSIKEMCAHVIKAIQVTLYKLHFYYLYFKQNISFRNRGCYLHYWVFRAQYKDLFISYKEIEFSLASVV